MGIIWSELDPSVMLIQRSVSHTFRDKRAGSGKTWQYRVKKQYSSSNIFSNRCIGIISEQEEGSFFHFKRNLT